MIKTRSGVLQVLQNVQPIYGGSASAERNEYVTLGRPVTAKLLTPCEVM